MANYTDQDQKNHRNIILLIWICIVGMIFLCSTPLITQADGIDIDKYESIAPVSIPLIEDPNNPTDGIKNVGVTMLRWEAVTGSTVITSITVQIEDTPDGSFNESNVEKISVYFEPKVGGDKYFNRGGGTDDIYVADESQNPTGPGIYTFDSGVTKTIYLTPDVAITDDNSKAFIYIAFDIAYNAGYTGTIRCLVTAVEWKDSSGSPTGTWVYTDFPVNHNNVLSKDVDTYETSLTATGVAPVSGTGEQGEDDVPILRLQLSANDATMDATDLYRNVNLEAITLHQIGTSYSDIDPGGISLYDDANNNGVIDGGEISIPAAVSPLTPSEYITITPTSNVTFDEAQISLIVTLNVAETAGVGNTVGLEIEDPSSDIAFNDIVDDWDSDTPAIYALVLEADQYVQEGYITASSPTPGSGNTFTVTPLPDTDPPQVAATVPRNNESGVIVTTDVTIIFNEDINPSTVSDTIFYVEDSTGTKVPGTVSASGSEVVFNPDSNFNYEEIYTATLEPGVEDIYGNAMTTTYTWSFATTANVARPVAGNNRILPGSTDPVQIHIPEPTGGPSERVTVQVFTTTGKKVATLINNRPYSQIESQLPLLWYGKNSRQQDLGPGLYFIQVLSGSDKTVLKVLIVR